MLGYLKDLCQANFVTYLVLTSPNKDDEAGIVGPMPVFLAQTQTSLVLAQDEEDMNPCMEKMWEFPKTRHWKV